MSVKTIVVGKTYCGKTCLINRIIKDVYVELGTSIHATVITTDLKYNDQVAKIQFNDIAGSEQYKSIVKSFFENTNIALVVFSIDDRSSFDEIDEWINSINEKVQTTNKNGPDYAALILVGAKSDKKNERAVSIEEAEEKAKSIGSPVDYVEVSSLSGEKIDKLRSMIVTQAIDIIKVLPRHDVVSIHGTKSEKKCCW